MKSVFTSLLLLCFSLGYSQLEKEDLAVIRAVFSKEKKVLAKDYMNFTNPDDRFWAVYDEYEKERSELSFERLGILRDYTDNYNDLTEKKIEDLMVRLFKNDAAFVDLLKKYYKKQLKFRVQKMQQNLFSWKIIFKPLFAKELWIMFHTLMSSINRTVACVRIGGVQYQFLFTFCSVFIDVLPPF